MRKLYKANDDEAKLVFPAVALLGEDPDALGKLDVAQGCHNL